MNGEEVEELLRSAGPPGQVPDRLRRAVLDAVGPWPVVRSRRRVRAGLALLAGLLLGSGAIGAAVYKLSQATDFHAVRTVELHSILGASAVAKLGAPNGADRPVKLIVQHLEPGAQHTFELWSLSAQAPIPLATFTTDKDGACIIILSVPSKLDWRDLLITRRDQSQEVVLCSAPAGC